MFLQELLARYLVGVSFFQPLVRGLEPDKGYSQLPSRSPVSESLSLPTRSIRDSEASGRAVWIQVPPSLSSRSPGTPVSDHSTNPKGVKAPPGSKYWSFPFSLTSTTLAFNFSLCIVIG